MPGMTPAPLFPTVPLLVQIAICVLGILVIVFFALYVVAELRAQNAEEAMEAQRQIIDQLRAREDELCRSLTGRLKAVSLVAGEMRKDLISDPASIGPYHVRRWMDTIQWATTTDAPDAPKGAQ